jgi:hypothetical protein
VPKRLLVLVVSAIALIPFMAFGRTFQIVDPGRVIESSRLVFVGEVKSVKASGISAPIHYVTWDQLSFPWLSVEVEVLEPFKGVEKGDIVRVMMLSIDRSGVVHGPILSPPVVLEPNLGDVFFLCLGRTPITNTFAALSGPYNEFLSVLPLHRRNKSSSLSDNTARNRLKDERFQHIWHLVDAKGDLIPDSVAKLRNAYAEDIRTPSKYDIIDLGSEENGWGSRLFKPGPYR